MTPPVLDFWFEFASTNSYPAMMRIAPLARAAGVMLRFRPFLLGPVFKAQGWETSPFNLYASKGRNMWRDLERICTDLKLPFGRPEPFPQTSLLATRVALVGLDANWGAPSPRDQPPFSQANSHSRSTAKMIMPA
jgi:2-hydroxychromene-2-carboxylate isomerase